jgi:hypothetical protein
MNLPQPDWSKQQQQHFFNALEIILSSPLSYGLSRLLLVEALAFLLRHWCCFDCSKQQPLFSCQFYLNYDWSKQHLLLPVFILSQPWLVKAATLLPSHGARYPHFPSDIGGDMTCRAICLQNFFYCLLSSLVFFMTSSSDMHVHMRKFCPNNL